MHQSLLQEILLEQLQLLQLGHQPFVVSLPKIQKLRVVPVPKKKRKHLLLQLHLPQQVQMQKKKREKKVNMNITMKMNGKKKSLKHQKQHQLPRPQQRPHLQYPLIEKLVWATLLLIAVATLLQAQTPRQPRDRTLITRKLRHRTQVDIHQ